jgi:hypothetical protein
MAVMSVPHVPLPVILIGIIAVYVLRRLFYEMTTGARRRQMIKDNGCEEVVWYPHKGIMGKLYGLDVIKEMVKSGKDGHMHEATRLRNFANGRNTVMIKFAKNTSQHTSPSLSS